MKAIALLIFLGLGFVCDAQTLSLSDIRDFRPETRSANGEKDPFVFEGVDCSKLDLYEKALAVASKTEDPVTKVILTKALETAIADFQEAAEQEIRAGWDAPFNSFLAPKTEILRADAAHIWEESPWKSKKPEKKDGTAIEWNNVQMVTPAGFRIMTDTGLIWLPFPELSEVCQLVYGWSIGDDEDYLEKREKLAKLAEDASQRIADESARKIPPPALMPAQGKETLALIRRNAEAKWKDDYRMVDFEMKKQLEAVAQIVNYRSSADLAGIIKNAEEKWGDDYAMVAYEIRKQKDARTRISK